MQNKNSTRKQSIVSENDMPRQRSKEYIIKFIKIVTPIDELCLSVRAELALMKKLGLKKIGEIFAYSERDLLNQTNIGKNGLKDQKETLSKHGLILKN